MHERETEIMLGNKEEEKRSCDENSSHERKIGGDGTREREKKRREEEKNFSPLRANAFACEEARERKMENFFHPDNIITRARGNLREIVCKRESDNMQS